MIKKVIHTADWHIKNYRYHNEYLDVFNNFFIEIKKLVKDYDREEIRIVIAGDIVHQKINITNEQLLVTVSIIKELEKIAPIVMIAGNHDLNLANPSRIDSLTPMVKLLPDLNIKYFTGESNCYLDNNIVWCVYSIFDDNRRPDIEKARDEYGDDKTYIGLYHGPVIGLKTDLGYEFDHGANINIFSRCDMVMMGDIHKRGGLILEDKIEVGEDEVEKYIKLGWEIYE
jgi:predicted MPP superfamily phosphohydrolase